MSALLGSIWWLIVSIGILVTIHEFGHFWVARRCGVKVLRFSVGFGKPLWLRRGRDGTEYAVAAIPLGGYVKMLDEREGDVPAGQAAQAFNRQPVWQKMAIVAAGPVANLLLCVVLLWAMFVVGRPDFQPIVGSSQGIAQAAGLRAGDRIAAIDGRATPTWSDVVMGLATAASERRDVRLSLGSEAARTVMLGLSAIPAEVDDTQALQAIGLVPRHHLLPPIVGRVEPGTAASGVLQPGDRLLRLEGQPLPSFDALGPAVQALQGRTATIEVERAGQRTALAITPRRQQDAGGQRWVLGIGPQPPQQAPVADALLRHGPVAAVPMAIRESGRLLAESVRMLGRLIRGQGSSKAVSGPITIARYANASAQLGPAWFLNFLALLSLSLALINLLPVPLLDGGHLVVYAIEGLSGRPLGDRAMMIGQYVGLAFLAGLMSLAFYNDILGLLG